MNEMQLLKKLITYDSSIRSQVDLVLDFAIEHLANHGIHGEIVDNKGFRSFVATIGEGPKTLVFNGHLDVVSGQKDQFLPYEKDGRIYGRGSADMKGGCVAMIGAMIALKNEKLNCKVMLQLVTDEETGGKKCSKYLVEQGYVGDFVICTEPTLMNISVQAKGIIIMDIVTKGVSAHGSRPWTGINAIEKSIANFEIIRALPVLSEGSDFYESSTVNLAMITGGDIYNRVPDRCVMGLDIRYVPHVNPETIVRDIESAIDGEVIVRSIEHGVRVDPNSDYIRQLELSFKAVAPKAEITFSGQHGGSDGRFFAAKGIPAIEFGPSGANWHGDDEYLDVESMQQLQLILIDYAKNFK
jgi:succinyl-diaminopimelate desuccinylase